jgi:hypothetical protein
MNLLESHAENSLATPTNHLPLLYLVPISTLTSTSDTTVVLKNVESSNFDDYARDNDAAFGTAPAAVEDMWRHAASIEPPTPKSTANPCTNALAVHR